MSGEVDTAKANDGCVGPSSEQAGKASACEGCPNQKACADGKGREEDPDLGLIRSRLANVKRKVLVLSGKGGVGKSTMSTQLAFALAADGLVTLSQNGDLGLVEVTAEGRWLIRTIAAVFDPSQRQRASGSRLI